MPLTQDRCICLRKVEYSETSQILWLFSRQHGKVHVVAKGAHRRTKAGASRFDGGIDLLDLGQGVFTDDASRELATLTDWKQIDGHLSLRQSLRAIHLSLYAAELVSHLVEAHDPHAELFDRLEQTLPLLATPMVEEAFFGFQTDLLRQTGYLPELFACVACGKAMGDATGRVAFVPSRGGIACNACVATLGAAIYLDARLLRLAQAVVKLPRVNGHPQRLPRLSRHQTDPINAMLAEHVEQTLGKRLRLTSLVVASCELRVASKGHAGPSPS